MEFSSALRAGSNPSVAEFADRVPELREQAVALLQSIVMFEQVSQQEDSRHRIDRTTNRFAQRKLDVLGDFKIMREIGRGGMGIIHEAEQLSLKRRVALKVLGPSVADSQKQLDRFRRESEAIARLHHTNIVPVFGVGTEEGVHYFAMQLIDGKPLSTPPELDFQAIARIGMQAASALAYAHEHGVLHRDIKPSNLLLDASGELWVTDIARIVEAELNEASHLLVGLCLDFPESEEYQLASAQVNRHRMQLFLFTRRGADSQAAFELARASLSKLIEIHPQNPKYMFELADTLSYASSRMQSISSTDEEKFLQQAIEIGEQLCAAFPAVPEYLALLASSRDKFGAFARQHEHWQDAEKNFSLAAEGMVALHKQFPDNGYYQLSSVLTLNNLAMLYLDEKSELASTDHWFTCRDRLQSAIESLNKADKMRDPFSDRLSVKSRETLMRLNKLLSK